MTWHTIVRNLWPIAMILFLSLSVSQLSESLRYKTASYHSLQPIHQTSAQNDVRPAPTRVNAMLGGACILLSTFWGFDAMLSWFLKLPF